MPTWRQSSPVLASAITAAMICVGAARNSALATITRLMNSQSSNPAMTDSVPAMGTSRIRPETVMAFGFPTARCTDLSPFLTVVPAKAGTHNHRGLKRSQIAPHREDTAYGSPLSRERHQNLIHHLRHARQKEPVDRKLRRNIAELAQCVDHGA